MFLLSSSIKSTSDTRRDLGKEKENKRDFIQICGIYVYLIIDFSPFILLDFSRYALKLKFKAVPRTDRFVLSSLKEKTASEFTSLQPSYIR